jgi:hypothetical protein
MVAAGRIEYTETVLENGDTEVSRQEHESPNPRGRVVEVYGAFGSGPRLDYTWRTWEVYLDGAHICNATDLAEAGRAITEQIKFLDRNFIDNVSDDADEYWRQARYEANTEETP